MPAPLSTTIIPPETAAGEAPRSVLLLSQCLLGDSLSLLPALHCLREQLPGARIGLVSERYPDGERLTAEAVLGGTGLVDRFYGMRVRGNRLVRLFDRLFLALRLRREGWEVGVVLIPPYPPATREFLQRMKRYLRGFGVRRAHGPEAVRAHTRTDAGILAPCAHVSDALLALLAPLRLDIPPPGEGDFSLPSGASPALRQRAGAWLEKLEALGPAAVPLALGAGSNMSAKQWGAERFRAVLDSVRREIAVIPVCFGAAGDRPVYEEITRDLPAKLLVLGEPIPVAAEVMAACRLYLGNDTGVMHLAAAKGVPCVAVFSARDVPGAWEPYGRGHRVFRAAADCEGCLLRDCPRNNACLRKIEPAAVAAACRSLLLTP